MSGTKNLQPLVITTKHAQQVGSEFTWNKLQDLESLIQSIVTQEVNVENSDELNKLISGIPTPFARASMFRYAITYGKPDGGNLNGLLAFYKTLQDEWKGLIACLALDNQPISVERIPLSYSDGKEVDETINLYEPKGAFGNMLFSDKALWSDQQDLLDGTKKSAPFIDLIRYNNTVIGAASPESFLFTAPTYSLNKENKFYSQVTKKFVDPLKAALTAEEVEKLYVYVQHINNSIDSFVGQFTKQKPDVRKISVFLNNWLGEIESYATTKGYTIDKNAIVPNLSKFHAPFDHLFNYQTKLYGYHGRIYSDLNSIPEGAEPIEVELSELLLDPDTSTITEILFDNPSDAEESGVLMLQAISANGKRYFSLPLSEKGLVIFQDTVEVLLSNSTDKSSHLSAIYDPELRSLVVTLSVDVNGNITSFTKSYKEPVLIEGQKVICWPNFISKVWNKYFLYSEIPHNAPDLKAFPLRADKEKFRLIGAEANGVYKFEKVDLKSRINDGAGAEILVDYDINKLGPNELKYEIYESSEPFKGIELQNKTKPAGYFVLKSIISENKNSLKRIDPSHVNPVRVGFDFGSNNICISYAKSSGKPELVTFKNRRRFLLGSEGENNIRTAAMPNEVFFFQNDQTTSNLIKSMVMTHDERRLRDIDSNAVNLLSIEVKGGFPVFEKNIPVEDSSDTTHTVRFAGQPSYIKYNMKWSSDKRENAYKQGLLSTLWLKTYAELYADNEAFYPESLVWAYPSSMNSSTVRAYHMMWLEIGKINPLESKYHPAQVAHYTGKTSTKQVAQPDTTSNNNSFGGGSFGGGTNSSVLTSADSSDSRNGNSLVALTEAASVCKYVLGPHNTLEVNDRSLVVGFDVGGSTTDILCLVSKKNKDTGSFESTLIKQSSIKFAAGKLADATKQSKQFQEVLKSFCRKKNLFVHGVTVPPEKLNSKTSAYYYNLIVDRLESEADLNEFYHSISVSCPDLFVINSYMTGLIMFYAGQLAWKIRETQEEKKEDYLNCFSQVMVGFFGKGGRMFDWLRAINEPVAFQYYQECFGAGYGFKASDHISKFSIEPSRHEYVKAEVSFGLALDNYINTTSEQISEIIGEEGFSYLGASIDQYDSVRVDQMKHFGTQFITPTEFKRFSQFASIFYGFSKQFFDFNMPTIGQDINNMRLKTYVENLPEYKLAKNSQDFDFEAPIIILEGMCFLDTILMPNLFGSKV